jgi:serine/threonine protein kinase
MGCCAGPRHSIGTFDAVLSAGGWTGKVTAEDTVKVLDFGLAKALENEVAAADIRNSPTVTRMATQAGIIIGTAAYMSPDQARDKSADRRADIWAFGCMLYDAARVGYS